MQKTPEDIAQDLLRYLQARTGDQNLAYAQAPEMIAGGFDAAIFGFSLNTNDASLAGPLVLRLFQRGRAPEMARKEAAVQSALAAMGLPAPAVKIDETDADILDGAFLIMERLPGRALASAFERLSREKHSIFWVIATVREIMRETGAIWDDAQRRLHALDADDFLACIAQAGLDPTAFTVEAELVRFKRKIPPDHAAAFAPGFSWLEQNIPPLTERRICHGDLQPLNVLADNGRLTGVLDWGATVVGHPAIDYGAVMAIMAAAPVPGPPVARPVLRMVMNTLARDHARPYFARHPDGGRALVYFAAYNCMSQLASVAAPRTESAARDGAFRSKQGVRNLVSGFQAYTGVRLRLTLL